MAKEVVFEVREAEEGGYYAAAVGYDIITQGDSWEDSETDGAGCRTVPFR